MLKHGFIYSNQYAPLHVICMNNLWYLRKDKGAQMTTDVIERLMVHKWPLVSKKEQRWVNDQW